MTRKRFLGIVDPWNEPMENDSIKYSFLKSDISAQCQIIYNQLSRLKPLFDDIIVIKSYSKTNPIFDELPSFDSVLGEYLSDKQDWDMWLCGFHYGRCIHLKINEVIEEYGWDYNRFHIIQNLSFMFPEDTKDIIINTVYPTRDALINTKEYYWDYVDSLTEL
tara:strand:+ start:23 stop:511 length:489 start_codon:yes stop_codon:yes gene_type:complete